MGLITRVECDFEKEGKKCPKSFILHDNPEENVKAVADIIQIILAGGQKLWFCNAAHALMWLVRYVKAAPVPPPKPPEEPKPTPQQIEKLEKMGVIEKIPPPPDDLGVTE